jgi:hypothetical protein
MGWTIKLAYPLTRLRGRLGRGAVRAAGVALVASHRAPSPTLPRKREREQQSAPEWHRPAITR